MGGAQPAIVGAEEDAVADEDDPGAQAVECPVCLGPGFLRSCCGDFFCNECYLKTGVCPGCGTKCVKRGFDYEVRRRRRRPRRERPVARCSLREARGVAVAPESRSGSHAARSCCGVSADGSDSPFLGACERPPPPPRAPAAASPLARCARRCTRNCGPLSAQVADPGLVPVGVGWAVTNSFLLSWLLVFILVVVDEVH